MRTIYLIPLLYSLFPIYMSGQNSKWNTIEPDRIIIEGLVPLSTTDNALSEDKNSVGSHIPDSNKHVMKIKVFTDSCFVKESNKKKWTLLSANFHYPENSETLQRKLTAVLFKKEANYIF